LIVLAELDLVVVNRFAKVLGHRVAIFDVVELLQTVDSDGEDLSAGLKDAAVLAFQLSDVLLGRLAIRYFSLRHL